MWATPEGREKMEAWRKKATLKAGRPEFVADGYTAKEIAVLRAQAEQDAERIMSIMEEENLFDLVEQPSDELLADDKAMSREAMKMAIVLMRMPGNVKDKLSAARTVLEYTRSKPAQTSNVTVATAEDFLAGLLAKDAAPKE